LKVDHPLDAPLFDLSPGASKLVTTCGLAALLAAFGWWTRRPYRGRHDPARLSEFAALLILMTLYSPVTWLQHLVWLIPATWLLAESRKTAQPWSKAAQATLWVYLVLALGLNRETLGRDNYYVLLSWHTHTVCQLLLLGLLVYVRRRSEQTAVAKPTETPLLRAA
jgi:hypothetical protein